MSQGQKKRLTFMNGGKHFWNRERKIIAELSNNFEIQLIVNHSGDINYSIDDISNFAEEQNIQLVIIDYTKRKASSIKGFYKDFETIRRIKRFRPDYIYIESFGSLSFAIYSGLFLPRARIIFAIMDYKLHPYGDSVGKFSEKIYKRFYLMWFRNFHLFSSEQAKALLSEYPKKKAYHIKLYLIENDFPEAIPTASRSFEKLNFLYFGKVYNYKGVDILIQASEILAKKRKDFKVTIAGRSSNFDPYRKLIKNPEIFDLKIHYLNREEIPKIFHDASYFVLPYREVTQSGPLSLSFHFGVCAITSDIEGFEELINHGDNGFTFQSESPESLSKLMDDLIETEIEAHRENQNRLQAYVNDEFAIERFVTDYINMFEKLVGR